MSTGSPALVRVRDVEFAADGVAEGSDGVDVRAGLEGSEGSDAQGPPELVVRLRPVEPFEVFYRRELRAVLARFAHAD